MSLRPCLAVDSDGTVLDSMTVKHVRAFTPALIETYELDSIREWAEPAFLRLNLRSPARGCNRFTALVLFFKHLPELLPATLPAGQMPRLPDLSAFLAWAEHSPSLSASALSGEIRRQPSDRGLALALAYSRNVDARVAGLPPPAPFPGAAEALRRAAGRANVAVVSSAPTATLQHEWTAAGIADLASSWGGQEAGSKTYLLRQLQAEGRPAGHILMVGDAPADRSAAHAAGVPFFPIVTGAEAASWRALHEQILPLWPAAPADTALSSLLAEWDARFLAALAEPAAAPSAPAKPAFASSSTLS